MPTDSPSAVPLLVRQLLLERSEGLGAREMAAFVQGWCSALELVERIDLTAPGAPEEVRYIIAEILARIARAQEEALRDE